MSTDSPSSQTLHDTTPNPNPNPNQPHDPTQDSTQDQDRSQNHDDDHDTSTAEARTAFIASLTSVGNNLDADLRSRATTLHENNAILAKQEDELKRTTQNMAKQGNELEQLVDMGSKGLKEVGDLQNWAELMERDLLVVEETVRLAEEDDAKNGRMGKGKESALRRWF